MARHSALSTVRDLGRVTTWDVMRTQGLCEIRARKALMDLVALGVVIKNGPYFEEKRR